MPFKTFTAPAGNCLTAHSYIWDPSLLVTGSDNAVYSTGGMRPLYASDFQTANVNIGDIEVAVDELEGITASGVRFQAAVSGQGAGYTTVNNSVPSGNLAVYTGILLQANQSRKEAYVQLIGSGGAGYLAFNTSPASASNVNVILAPSTTDWGTNGGVWSSERYKGAVSFSGSLGTRFLAWENAN